MAIMGSLKEMSLPDVIQMLALGKKSGVLSVTNRENFAYIYFEDGKIIEARLVSKENRIGEILLKNGIITEEDLKRALEIQKEKKIPLGDILVEEGIVDEEKLRDGLKKQIEETLFTLFTWEDGYFNFEPEVYPQEKRVHIQVNPEDILLEAARLFDELKVTRLPDRDMILIPENPDVEMDEKERRIFSLIDGKRSVEEVVAASGDEEFEVMKVIIFLLGKGAIREGEKKKLTREKELARIGEHENLGIAFLEMDMLDEAEREFRRIVEIDPSSLSGNFYLSLVKFRKKEYEEAERLLKKLIELGQRRPGVYANLACILEAQERLDEAERILTDALQNYPENFHLLLNMGIIKLKKGNLEDAFLYLEKAKEIDPSSYLSYFYLGYVLASMGKVAEALDMMLRGAEHKPQDPAYFHNLARLYEETGELERAEEMYKRAIEMDKEFLPSLHALAEFYYRNGFFDLAKEVYETLAEKEENWEVFFKLGNIYYRDGEKERAKTAWEHALKLNPESEIIKKNLKLAEG